MKKNKFVFLKLVLFVFFIFFVGCSAIKNDCNNYDVYPPVFDSNDKLDEKETEVEKDNTNNIVYLVNYELDGGVNSAANPTTYVKDDTIKFFNPTKRAYDFIGWSFTANGKIVLTEEIEYSGEGNITLYANWKYNPTSEEYLSDKILKCYPNHVYATIQEKISLDYELTGFEVYKTIIEGCYVVCYFYPDNILDNNIIPCGVVLINFPITSQLPKVISVSWKEYVLVSSFEYDSLGQYQFKEDDKFYLYDVYGSTAYIEYYDSVSQVDEAIQNGTSKWDLDIYAWDYDNDDFLTIPFDLIEDYDPTYEWQLFGDYTTTKLIDELQNLEILQSATSIETFTGVFFSEELAKYIEQCILSGEKIYINNVPLEEIVKLSTEKQEAGKLLVIELDGTIGEIFWYEEWSCDDELNLVEQQINQIYEQLVIMGGKIVVGVALTPFTAGASIPTSMAIGAAFEFGTELLQQVYVQDIEWSEVDWGSIGLQMGLGAITAGLSTGVCQWAQSVIQTSPTLAKMLPTITKGFDVTLDIGATVIYDLSQGYNWNQIKNDIAMTVFTNAVISMVTDSCFAEGTKIATPFGNINIKDISKGDYVYSFNDGNIVIGKVSKVYVRKSPIVSLFLSNGEVIRTTIKHPFYVDGKYVEARNLKINDKLKSIDDSSIYIKNVRLENYCTDVYNFEVEKFHNYYADGVLVHNSCGPKVQELIYSNYEHVTHKTNYNPRMADIKTQVYLIKVNEEALYQKVSGKILDVYPHLKGKTYKDACVFFNGDYILKIGTTINDFDIRYSSNIEFQKLYGLQKKDITPKIIALTTQKEALMIESQILKNISLSGVKPIPGNSSYVEYGKTTRYLYEIDIYNDIEWYIDNPEVYLGYGD